MTGATARFFAPTRAQADTVREKAARLAASLRGLGRTLVAYSGGVDSAFLLAEAHRALGDDAVGVIARSASLPESELRDALAVAAARGIPVRVIETRELERADYRANAGDRCYHCKSELFERLEQTARAEGFASLAYGAVTDDLGDVRPGMRAAEEFRVRAPLLEAGLGKLEVRLLARRLGLPVWDKPQSACLASRIPIGDEVTAEKLGQVERAEASIRARFGPRVLRVRHHGALALIEVGPEDLARMRAPDVLASISECLEPLGFTRVELDERGYRRADPLPSRETED
ncbi:MAG: ATP-dependent sacrificial sulfur transferase LarE [Hyphomicrobiales bacterium]